MRACRRTLNHASDRSWNADRRAVFGFISQLSGRLWQHQKEASAEVSVFRGQYPRRRLNIQQCAADLDRTAGRQDRFGARIKHAQLSANRFQPGSRGGKTSTTLPRSVDSRLKHPWLTVAVPRRGARPYVRGSFAGGVRASRTSSGSTEGSQLQPSAIATAHSAIAKGPRL